MTPGRHEHGNTSSPIRPRLGAVVLLGLVASAAIASAAGAQNEPPELPARELTPEDCVEIALERNYDVLVAEDDAERASGQARQALAGVLPSLSATAAYRHDRLRSKGATLVGTIPVEDLGRRRSDARSAGLQLNHPLFDWSNWQTLKSARRAADASGIDVGTQQLAIALEVKIRYYEYLKAARLHEVRLESVGLRNQQLERAQTLFDVGSVARSDVLQAQVNLQQARLEEIEARNLVDLERSRLAQLMGLPVDTPLDILDDLEVPESAPPDSAAIWAESMQQRPDLQAARLRVLAGESNLSSARAKRYPTLFARAALSATRSSTISFDDSAIDDPSTPEDERRNPNASSDFDSWDFVAGVSWNIFDGMLTEGQVREAKASFSRTEYQLQQLELLAALELTEALLGIRAAQQSIAVATEAVALAEENNKLAEERYQLGSGTLLELEEAQVGLIDARRTLVESQALLKVAEATLDKARGRVPVGAR